VRSKRQDPLAAGLNFPIRHLPLATALNPPVRQAEPRLGIVAAELGGREFDPQGVAKWLRTKYGPVSGEGKKPPAQVRAANGQEQRVALTSCSFGAYWDDNYQLI
jgi:hypothetical protein